jgi:chemotaxis protein MotB
MRSTQPSAISFQQKNRPSEDETSWWSITFSDLVLLLFCFFVLWHVADKQRAVTAARTAVPAATRATLPTAPIETPSSPPLEEVAQSSAPASTSEQTDVPSVASSSSPSSVMTAETTPEEEQPWRTLAAEIDRYIHSHHLDHAVGVVSTRHGLVISLHDTIIFPSGQATLNPAVTPLLARVAALAAQEPDLSLEISGHTDDRPIATPAFPSNWELSSARASRVARALLEQGTITPGRISTRGYAHYRPLYPNDNEAHRAANRRVELRFFHEVARPDDLSANNAY